MHSVVWKPELDREPEQPSKPRHGVYFLQKKTRQQYCNYRSQIRFIFNKQRYKFIIFLLYILYSWFFFHIFSFNKCNCSTIMRILVILVIICALCMQKYSNSHSRLFIFGIAVSSGIKILKNHSLTNPYRL